MTYPETPWNCYPEYIQRFRRKFLEQRVPISGSIDLTHRCNLRCIHCYVGPEHARSRTIRSEMTGEEIITIINEIAAAGCLFLLITGGEPLLRGDFSTIYCHARKKGLVVTVFTNGTCITEDIISIFSDLPPYLVEITLNGARKETYEKISGIKGSYRKCLAGIERLLNNGINVGLKAMLMTLNREEFPTIKKLADEYGVKFRFDAALFPCINGDKSPICLRIPPEEAIALELKDRKILQGWTDYFKRTKETPASDALYQCGAGLFSFHIDPYGNLQPCLMAVDYKYNLLKGDFQEGWRNIIPHFRDIKAGDGYACHTCDARTICGQCPAFFKLEMDNENIRSQYVCAMGRERFAMINRFIEN